MKNAKGYVIIAIVIFLILSSTLFIISNSLLNFESSHRLSGIIFKFLFSDTAAKDGADDFLLRKAAHLIEYALLGSGVMCMVAFCKKKYNKNIFVYSFGYVVAVAALDEYIQSRSDRNGTVSDVILDLVGAVIGIAFTCGIIWLVKYLKAKKTGG